jgi:hypothetical protein
MLAHPVDRTKLIKPMSIFKAFRSGCMAFFSGIGFYLQRGNQNG